MTAPVLTLPKLFGNSTADPPGVAPDTAGEQPGRFSGLVVDGRPLFPLPAGDLARYAGQAVEGEAAVLAVVSEDAFWVGSDASQRLLVWQPGAPVPLEEAAPLWLEATVRPLPPDFADRLGVASPEDQARVRNQGVYLEATRVEPA